MTEPGINRVLLDRLCLIVGLFGQRGWPEVEVQVDDDNTQRWPLPEYAAMKVQAARKLLAEHGRLPTKFEPNELGS